MANSKVENSVQASSRGLHYKTFYGRNFGHMYRNKLEGLPQPFTSIQLQYLWVRLEPTTLAYYDTTKNTAVKCFIVQAQLAEVS
jgi:hypothetical protein